MLAGQHLLAMIATIMSPTTTPTASRTIEGSTVATLRIRLSMRQGSRSYMMLAPAWVPTTADPMLDASSPIAKITAASGPTTLTAPTTASADPVA